MCGRGTTWRRRSRAAGHRVLVPYLRGYGPTRFRDAGRAADGGAGRDRPGPRRFRRRARPRALCRRGLRLGRTCRVHRRRASSRSCACGRADWRLFDSGHHRAAAPGGTGSGTGALVSVVLQHRARARGARRESPRPLPPAVENLVADLALHRRDVQQNGRARSTTRISSTSSSTPIATAISMRPASRGSPRSNVNSPDARRSTSRRSCSTARTTASRGRRPIHRPIARRSRSSWPAASSRMPVISCRVKNPRPCRRRCWSCWRHSLAQDRISDSADARGWVVDYANPQS